MSNIYTLALRKAAERALADNHTQDEWFHYLRCSTPETVLALLDELEAVQTVSAARLVAIDTTHKMFQRERDRAEKAEKRVAELEVLARGVKQFSEFQICHYGATEDYAKGYIDCQNNYNKVLFAAAGKGE